MAKFIKIWQTIFALSVLATVIILAQQLSSLQIDTDLADMTPATRVSEQTREATRQLRSNIEKRIVILIMASDEDLAFDAEDALRDKLANSSKLTILPNNDDLAEKVLEGLMPYRFSLLSKQQQQRLQNQSVNDIANKVKADLYKVNGQLRVFSFADDPLAWHSETLLSLLPSDKGIESDVFTATIGASIERGALNMNAQALLEQQLNQAIDSVKSEFKVDVFRSGIFFFASEAAQKSKQDITLITTGSSLGVVLLLLFVFRNLRALMLPIASVLLGVGFAFTLTHLVFGKVHVLTIVFGASLIGIVIDYSLHYFYHGASHTSAQKDSKSNEKKALFSALSLSLMTSVIGYAALSFSSLEALQKVAFFSCCGLFMAWLSVISLGDLALRKAIKVESSLLPLLVSKLQQGCSVLPRKFGLLLCAIVLVSGAFSLFIDKPFNDDPRLFFKANAELLSNEKRVAELASDYEPGRHFVVSGNNVQQLYQRYNALMTIIENDAQLQANDLTSVLAWVPSEAQQKQNYRAQEKLYGPNQAAQQLALVLNKPSASDGIQAEYAKAQQRVLTPSNAMSLFGNSLPPIWFDQNNQLVSFVLIKKGVTADHLSASLNNLKGVEYVNSLQRTEQALTTQRQSATRLLLLAYALVALVLIIKMRKITALSLVMTPMCASAMMFVCASLIGFDLNLFHVMALFLVLGFGMDYSIFAYEMREHSNVTLQAILLSAITSLISFGLLGLSSIPVVASFGITLLIGNSFNLIGVFIYTRLLSRTFSENSLQKAE